MRKLNNKKSLILAAGGNKYVPNVVKGGAAIPLGDNFYYMKGRKHTSGGIDIGEDNKTGLEVEGEEVMKVSPKGVKVYSSVPFLRGKSPAELVLDGANPNKVFDAQEDFKDKNRINDDGTKYQTGGEIPTNRNSFLDNWNAARLATGKFNNQLGDGRMERQAESRNTAKEYKSPIAFSMNYGRKATVKTPSMTDEQYRHNVAYSAQAMKNRISTPETGQGVIGGVYHKPTHTSYINQEEFAKDPTIRTHENSHASRAIEQEGVIGNIISSDDKSMYLRRPTEIYSRLMQFREANNIDPNTVYDKSSLKDLKKTAKDYNILNTFKDEEVLDLLNNVAMNGDTNKLNLNNLNANNVPIANLNMAKYGTKKEAKMGNLSRSKDYGSDKKPYPSVNKNDFAGSGRSYPIPTKADAVDALRLAGLHGRSDVRAKVYRKYPELKKCNGGIVSINGNVRNGLISYNNTDKLELGGERKPRFNGRFAKPGLHNLSLIASTVLLPKGNVNGIDDNKEKVSEVDIYNRLHTADISNKTDSISKDNTNIRTIHSERERRKKKFAIGGNIENKDYRNFDMINRKYVRRGYSKTPVEVSDFEEMNNNKFVPKEVKVSPKKKVDNKAADEWKQRVADYAFNYVNNKKEEPISIVPKDSYGNNVNTNNTDKPVNSTNATNKNNIVSTPRRGLTRSNKSKIANIDYTGLNNLDNEPTRKAVLDLINNDIENEKAGIISNTPLQSRINKNTDNNLNNLLYNTKNENAKKQRNFDNTLLGVNLGGSVIDAVMGNIFLNQMHGYTAPTINAQQMQAAPEIKLDEEDLKDLPAPVLASAAKLKTRYNVNPQLAKIEDEARRAEQDIDRNTSNSRVALARKQRARLSSQQAKNEVYGQQENIETELINRDKLNQQEVGARNIAQYNQYLNNLSNQKEQRARLKLAVNQANVANKLAVDQFNTSAKSQADQVNNQNLINQILYNGNLSAAKAQGRADIISNLLGNVGGALTNWNNNRKQDRLDRETLKVLGLRAPNVNKLMLRALGIE